MDVMGAWWMAIRPRTLTAAVAPVAVGTALAFREGSARVLPALAALVGATLIQIGTNLANDYYDHRRGADTADRLGPTRVTQAGLLAPASVLGGAFAAFGLAMAVGLYLASVGGWPIVVVGLVSILAGYAYTGGPFPLAYHGLGEVFVFVFFGLVAVEGTYYVQALRLSGPALVAAVPIGLLATALLAVNNLRDRDTDRRAGKRTLAVRLGETAARAEVVALVVAAFGAPLVLLAAGWAGPAVLAAWLCAPLAWPLIRGALGGSGASLNRTLAQTARLKLVFSLLLAVGLLW